MSDPNAPRASRAIPKRTTDREQGDRIFREVLAATGCDYHAIVSRPRWELGKSRLVEDSAVAS